MIDLKYLIVEFYNEDGSMQVKIEDILNPFCPTLNKVKLFYKGKEMLFINDDSPIDCHLNKG